MKLTAAERDALDEVIYDASLDMHQRSDRAAVLVEKIVKTHVEDAWADGFEAAR